MRRTTLACLLALAAAPIPLPAQQPPSACASSGRLALVLSGGGAKGMAHVGVLRVLDSLGIRPDLIVGTSMGSIIGAMYASGYTPDQIAAQARGLNLDRLFSGDVARAPRSLGRRRPLVTWEPGGGGLHTGGSSARQAAVSAALDRTLLRGDLQARGNFDSLFIPFRAVATDLRTRAEVVLASGDLARAVRASMAIPLVFDPERIGGRDLVDGGLAANVPIRAAREAGAERVIVSDVGWRPPDSVQADAPLVVADLLVSYLFSQPLDSLGPDDRLIRPAVDSFATLDFAPARIDSAIRLGHQAAVAALGGYPVCGARAPSRPARAVYRIAEIHIAEGPPSALATLRRQLDIAPGEYVDVAGLRSRLLSIGEGDNYQEVWLHPSGPADSLSLALSVRPAPKRLVVGGVTYDNDIGGQLWIGGLDRGVLLPGLETALSAVLGELRQQLELGLRPSAVWPRVPRPVLTGLIARESVREFTPGGASAPEVHTREAMGLLGVEREFGPEWLVTLGGFAHAWDAPGSGRYHGLGGLFRISGGHPYSASGLWGEGVLTDAYSRVELQAQQAVVVGAGFGLTPEIQFGWGRHLPLERTFPLGGTDGFPGLNIGERRGDRETVAALLLTHPLFGPVEARVTVETGQTAAGGPIIPRGRWNLGGRFGLGAETPIGPARVEYGVSQNGRNGVFLRLGEWF
ncbi:MAG TPA: patatin-like phospholipase family protein [Gemmatimonadales bacterium]|nr:patatin-like phospholipase family protein [Gemmatimonadales bacterium]